MRRITVRLGQGKVELKKSEKYIGLKTFPSRSVEQPEAIQKSKQIIKNLGGFEVMEVEDDDNHIDDKLDQIREESVVDIGTHIYHIEGVDKPIVATGEIYIIFVPEVDEDEQEIVLDQFHLELIERRDVNRVIARVTTQSPNPFKTAYFLERYSMVQSAEADIDVPMDEYDFTLPDEDLFPRQWHLDNKGIIPDDKYPIRKGADAKVVDAWKRLGNKGSSDIVIAVVDNGFDVTHPDLKDNIVKPFDFWTQSATLSQDGHGFTHGTPCAGVALARENARGIIGAAPNAKFMPLSGTSFDWRTTEDIFSYCTKNGADIISCSWGSTDPRFVLNAIKKDAISKAAKEGRNGLGAVILYAAGNDSLDYINYYAAHPDVIAIGASTSKDEHALYSNQGPEVWVCAPSNGDWPIIAPKASWDEGRWFDNISRGETGLYKHFGGTSSATPLAAGIVALMLSANSKLTAKEVKQILAQTADKIGNPSDYDSRGHSKKYGYGRVNADKAVAESIRRKELSDAPPPVITDSVQTGRGLFKFSVERQPSEGYGVQIGVFAEYGNVLIQAERMQRLFNSAAIVNINELKGKTVYRVVVGAFQRRSDASKLQREMRDKGVDGFVKNLSTLK